MHKITKGLKKKKKGKKSKHKEEELFKPEELEAYRREHQHTSETGEIAESAAPADNEEWKKFNALTAGIDTILKKTQGDLDRIKTTSYFQRVPPPSEIKRREEEKNALEKESIEKVESKSISVTEAAIVPVSDSESEYEDDDDIFDTTYIDVIASGEVKLAYIPESPKEEPEGDDPFDTSIAERAILGPGVDKKGKKLVSIGSAVEILTGRVQAPTCVPIKRPNTRRQIQKEKDLLLESFDDNANSIRTTVKAGSPTKNATTLLDDDAPVELLNTPIDLSQSLHLAAAATASVTTGDKETNNKFSVLQEFENVRHNLSDEDENDEFALLAAESLNKKIVVSTVPLSVNSTATLEEGKESWDAFYEETAVRSIDEFAADEDDPFDTTFAENILPGKAELKIIEDEILNIADFNLHSNDTAVNNVTHKVSIQVTDPTGQRESVITADRVSEQELNLIQPCHRDLLGGSSTDLSILGDQPLQPRDTVSEDYIEYCDPFDTSIVESAKVPGQTELKFLERELLGELKRSLSDEHFDPREDEVLEKQQTRKVSFDLPLEQHQNLLEGSNRISKPLTPYYIRENSIPEIDEVSDPFDTSFVSDVAPGKAELKLIESELFEKNLDSIYDPDFDPRDDKKIAVVEIVQKIEQIITSENSKPNNLALHQKRVDLLSAVNDVEAKVLTPATEKSIVEDYSDPFDTSIACNILPGKTELKLLENELINTKQNVLKVYDFTTTNVQKSQITNKNLIEEESSSVDVKPLTPILDQEAEFKSVTTENIDPFDTSIASNIGLGKTELKILESELI